MNRFDGWKWLRGAVLLAAGGVVAGQSGAVRVGGTVAPAASAVRSAPQQSAEAQADESASLRQGTITAVDGTGARLQVQGLWLAVDVGKTKVIRDGRPATVQSLKVGDTIRFTVSGASVDASVLRVIYAP